MNASQLGEHRRSKATQRDNVLGTVLLLVLLVLVAAFLSFRGMFLGFWVDECGVVTVPCEPGLFRAGLITGFFSPWSSSSSRYCSRLSSWPFVVEPSGFLCSRSP